MFHANGWTFVWTNTAVGATHVCLRRLDPVTIYEPMRNKRVTMLCASTTVLISMVNASSDLHSDVPKGIRVMTAGAPPAAATIDRVEGQLGWQITQVYGLTETAPFITVCETLPEHSNLS